MAESASIESRAAYYLEFLAERDEILRHKYFKSIEAGRDVGFETALLDWVERHRSGWKKERKKNDE